MRDLAGEGKLRLAGHLAELAALAASDDATVQTVRGRYEQRASAESSLMAKGSFSAAASDSRAKTAGGFNRQPLLSDC